MFDHPVYIRMPTESNKPYFKNSSSAEVVVSALIGAQRTGWVRLHGFIVLPDALEMVCTPIKQGISGVVAHIQSQAIPLLTILLPDAALIWERDFVYTHLTTQRALDARLNMLLLSPVANGITQTAEEFPYSSANPRYQATVSVFAGFQMVDEASVAITTEANGATRVKSPPVHDAGD
ncbi:MAG: hypothetical protein D6737_14335 [Chloroflexi bacterium]|nr:MAG: hypothetical protein D6737_14335 [Chloroflexota bacterium]